MAKKVRLEGIDFLKVFAIFGVVCLHVAGAYYDVGSQNRSLEAAFTPVKFYYYLGALAIPLFFCVNGFLILGKEKVTYGYILRKIGMLLTPVALWAIIDAVAKLIVRREFANPLESAVGYLMQQGLFSQFWFIGSLVIVQLMAPLLNRLLREHWVIFQTIIFVLGTICLVIFSFSYFLQRPVEKGVVQTFRLWTWFFYFMMGAAVRRRKHLRGIAKNSRLGFFVFTVVVVQIGSIVSSTMLQNGYAEYNYDSVFVMLAVAMLMLLYSNVISLQRGRLVDRIIHHFATNTMGIFIVHILVLKVFLRLTRATDSILTPLAIIIVFLISDLLVSCLQRFSFTSRLVSID